jgi:mannosyltransferase OCH1-like enzyme
MIKNILLLILIFVLLYFFINNDSKSNKNEKFGNIIPKIIHQTAPSNKDKWHPIWFEYQKTWHKYFPSPEYKYVLWSDDDLENLIKYDFPSFYPIYINYNKNIKRIDIARYFILYKYGGIYADMDYKCFKNFYDLLPQDKISISESPYPNNEFIQNALMVSPAKHPFWLKVIEEAKNRTNYPVLVATGPVLLSDMYFDNVNDINVLPVHTWNPHKDEPDNDKMITRHYGTVSYI